MKRLLLCLLHICLALANVEKTIFVAPQAEQLPQDASIDNLLLMRLSEQYPSARTHLNATFPGANSTKGTETWLLLEHLTPGQRYEVRICWLATQPTSFWLYTHTITEAFEDPPLLTSLSRYSHTRHEQLKDSDKHKLQARKAVLGSQQKPTTFLFLQVHAAADYFSLNTTLMEVVPPVAVDIILDPYLLNIFPRSLLPIAGYIMLIAAVAWFLSSWIARRLVTPHEQRKDAARKVK